MAGFPLMAFGAGLGQWAEARARQQEAQARNAMLALTLQKYRDELEDRQAKGQASDALSNFDFSGLLGGIKPVNPTGVDGGAGSSRAPFAPFSAGLPAASSMAPSSPRPGLPPGVGGAQRSAGDAWLAQNLPVGSIGGGPVPSAGALPWRPDLPAGLETSGPGAPPAGGGMSPQPPIPPRGQAPNAPQQFAGASGQIPGYPSIGPGAKGQADRDYIAQNQPSAGTQQQAQSPIPGINIPPPENIDFGQIMRTLKQQNPTYGARALQMAAEAVQKRLGENYKSAFDRWAKLTDFGLREAGQRETGRHNVATETLGTQQLGETSRSNVATEADRARQRQQQDVALGYEGRRTTVTESGQAETGRANLATEADRAVQRRQEGERIDITRTGQASEIEDRTIKQKHEAMRIADTQERTRLMKEVAAGRKTKVQAEQELGITQARTLAYRARDLADAVNKNPNLVGTRGYLDMLRGSVTEQAKLGVTHRELAEFQSEINLLRAEVLKPMAINKYMTKGALAELKKLVPSDEALTSPTQAKAALLGLARHLEQRVADTEAVMGGVAKDYEINDDIAKKWLQDHGMGAQQ